MNFLTNLLGHFHISGFHIPSTSSVFITFDDGLHDQSFKLFEFLLKEQISATHFILLKDIERLKILPTHLLQSQTFAIHGYEHISYTWLSPKKLNSQFEKIDQFLKNCPYPIRPFFRPPYGSWHHKLHQLLEKRQFKLLYWTYLYPDYKNDFSLKQYSQLKKQLFPGAILTFHDHPEQYEKLFSLLKKLKNDVMQKGLNLSCLS